MRYYMINNINFHELENQKYWSFPSSTKENIKNKVKEYILSGAYIGSRKMDGALYKFIKNDDGTMELLGRNKSVNGDYLNKIDWVPHLHNFFNALPNGTCILGELYFPNNEGSSNVTKIIGCLKDKAIKRQNDGDKLHYYIFDILAYDGEILYTQPIEDRILYLYNVNLIANALPAIEIDVANYYEGESLWDKLQKILYTGGEGIVITKKGTCYQPGKRPARQTIKVKKEIQDTLDVIIIGAKKPTRNYNGNNLSSWKYWENIITDEKINKELYEEYSNGAPVEPVTKAYFYDYPTSFEIGVYKGENLVRIGSVSGIQEIILKNWKQYIGKVCEISCMEIMNETKGLRHPKFIQIREDKDKKDTTKWEDIFICE